MTSPHSMMAFASCYSGSCLLVTTALLSQYAQKDFELYHIPPAILFTYSIFLMYHVKREQSEE
ncbi:hypothetical protein QC764_117752 [Podospora pseudoanserina]|uniref:Uncharacterized protein n=1 Tax=Podospora pseudoanserina TaxID=2609844 RepID=A0ABR0IR58_9PEZI|nr:hypothetical protein QC764_117752 [Podospora pseudoanserina]